MGHSYHAEPMQRQIRPVEDVRRPAAEASSGEQKYRAFISYSHADTAWAKWLHRGLETFVIDKDLADRETSTGKIPNALRPIFRDRDEFTAGHALAEQTLAALDASEGLIVICSPAAAKSHYVNEEIKLFKSRHPKRPVIPLIVAGKPDSPELECFPPALKFKLDAKGRVSRKKVEMLAADAREEGDGKNLALAKVIAGLLGLSSDEIFRRAERERRGAARRRRRVQAIVSALALLLVLAGVGWLEERYLQDRYYWHAVMGGNPLGDAAERALTPGQEFSECARGCPTMIVVPAGEFMMGLEEGGHTNKANERPQHKVTFAKPFAVGKFEVTFDEWDVCVGAGDCQQVGEGTRSGSSGSQPVAKISWDDAQRFVAWLARLTGKPYRLLTEAEWEYSARAGTTTHYSFGDDINLLEDYAWDAQNSKWSSHPVGEKKPNAFGLYDVHGNVDEWVEDRYHKDYESAPADGSAWNEGGEYGRVLRGGSWGDLYTDLTSTVREGRDTDFRLDYDGFRVARTLER